MSSKHASDSSGRSWSLAVRLAVWFALSAFSLLLLGTGYLYWALVANLDREDDASLANKIRVLRAVLRNRPDDEAAIKQEVEWAYAARRQAKTSVRILDEGGRIVAETPGMDRLLTADTFPSAIGIDEEPSHPISMQSANGIRLRILSAQARVGEAGQSLRIVQVALDRSQKEELLASYRRNLFLVLGVAVVLCSLGGYWIARRGIRPLEEITATARRIRASTLSERLATAGMPSELVSLSATFNEMLDRLEESFSRLARFSADIAHELRTPVNNLRGEVEVALGKARSPEEYRDLLGSFLEECLRLSRMIDSLLFLARAENPKMQIEKERLDLSRELLAVQEFYEPAASEAGVKLTVTAERNLAVDLNRPLLQRAVGNLVDNALAHTAPGGSITLTADQNNGQVHIAVADTGCGVAAEHLPRLFDRLYRVDSARSSTGGGAGLGLAIVKSIAELHGGTVAISSQVGKGTRISLNFPSAPPQDKPTAR